MVLAFMDRLAAFLLGIPETAGLFVIGVGLVLGVVIVRRIVLRAGIVRKNEEPDKNIRQA